MNAGRSTNRLICGAAATLFALAGCNPKEPAGIAGWLNWRGPGQDGASPETGLPATCQPRGNDELWDKPLSGRGAPVVAAGRVWCIEGATPESEALVCLDAKTGKELWRRELEAASGWLDRQRATRGCASPAIDPETGSLFALGSWGMLRAISPEGEVLWQRALGEEFGWLGSLNGPAAPTVDGDRVIVHGLASGWGDAPELRDRFLAFDTRSGDLVWSQAPGMATREAAVSTPLFDWRANQRVLYAGTGCGHLVALDARTGAVLWRLRLSTRPVHASPLKAASNLLIAAAVADNENACTESLVALRLTADAASDKEPAAAWTAAAARIDTQAAAARAVSWFAPAGSPILANGHIWHTCLDGIARAFDPDTGRLLRQLKLAGAWPAAPPTAADGRLFAPAGRTDFAIASLAEKPEAPVRSALDGTCTGAPAVHDGRVFVLTTRHLYCFGSRHGNPKDAPPWPKPGLPGQTSNPARLQITPAEILMTPGRCRRLRVRALDAKGNPYADNVRAAWQPVGPVPPPEPAVRISEDHEAVAPAGACPWAGLFEADSGGIKGRVHVRLLPAGLYQENFEGAPPPLPGTAAPPPAFWLAATPTWQIEPAGDQKALAVTVGPGERRTAFFGSQESTEGSLAVDVSIEGTVRPEGRLGLILQRYAVALDANWQRIEIEGSGRNPLPSAPFELKPAAWYRLRMSVELRPGGAAFVRARAWPRDQPEPHVWHLEALDVSGHTEGSPGLFAEGTATAPQRFLFDNVALGPSP